MSFYNVVTKCENMRIFDILRVEKKCVHRYLTLQKYQQGSHADPGVELQSNLREQTQLLLF